MRLVVAASDGGERLDKLLAREVPGVGRKRARELCERGRVRVDGRRAQPAQPVTAGATIELSLDDEGPVPEPELALDVRLELANVLVVHKPPGQPSAALRSGERGTLVNALLGRYPELAGERSEPAEGGGGAVAKRAAGARPPSRSEASRGGKAPF